MKRDIDARRITRRQALRGAAGAGGLAVFGGLLSACGTDNSATSALSAASGPSAASGQSPASGQSAASGQSTAPAGGSGATDTKIVMVNYPGWIGKTEVADFASKTGIKVHQVTGLTDGGSASQAAQLSRNKGQYDMALSGNVLAQTLDIAKMVQPVDFDKIPNRAAVEKRFLDQFKWGIPVEYGKLGIAYRKDLLPKPPTSWAELLDMAPSLSGKFTFPDYDVDVMSIAILALGYDINTADPKEINAARDALIKIKPYLKAFLATDAAKPLINGSVSLAALHDYDMPSAMKANDQIQWIAPDEGMPSYIDGWLALSGTTQTTAIEEFMNFHLEPEVYGKFINNTGAAYILPDAEPYIDEEILNNPALRLDKSANLQWQSFISPEGTKARNTAWTEVKAA